VDPGWFVVLTALGLSGLIRLVWGGRGRKKEIQKELASRPLSRIGEASGAALRVAGRLQVRGDLLTAPVSGRPCVAFQLRVEEFKTQNRIAGWHTLLDLQDARSFGLSDETGDALVDAGTPFLLALVLDVKGGTGWPDAVDAAQMATVDTLIGRKPKDQRRLRFAEGVLNEGDLVSVAGSGDRTLNPTERSLRDPPMWLVLRGTDEEPLWISSAADFGPVGYD